MRLGIIGSWGHFVSVLDETDGMPEVRVVGLARGGVEENFDGVRKCYPSTADAPEFEDADTLLRKTTPDVVLVSTRIDRIAGLAIQAVESGCHVICEKPLAISHAVLRRLWDAVVANRVQCYAMLAGRAHPVLAAACLAVNEGLIGDVKLINARKSYKFGTQRPAWCGERLVYGGTIPWVGIRALDFIDAVTGARATRVSALHMNTVHPGWPDCEDVAVVAIELENGAMASVSIDLLRPEAAPTHGDDWIRIVGEHGVIRVALDQGCLTVITHSKAERTLMTAEPVPYYAPLIRCLPRPGASGPDSTSRRSFSLTHTALHARDAADAGALRSVPAGPWDDHQALTACT